MPPKKLTKKQQDIEKLKEEYFNHDDKLQKMVVYDKFDRLLYEYSYIPAKTKVFKVYYENDAGDFVSQETFNKLKLEGKNGDIVALEVTKENEGQLLEAFEYGKIEECDSDVIQIKIKKNKIPTIKDIKIE